jgi:hypothetical protein
MRTKRIPVLVATGVLGLALGTGVGIAAARPDSTVAPAATVSGSMMGSTHGGAVPVDMDAMHAAMRDRMPASVRQRCDALHEQTR